MNTRTLRREHNEKGFDLHHGGGFFIAAAVGLTYWIHRAQFPAEMASVQDDGVYFGMSERALTKIKGEPSEIENDIGDTPLDVYAFTENLYGKTAESEYFFSKTLFGKELTKVSCDIRFENGVLTVDVESQY